MARTKAPPAPVPVEIRPPLTLEVPLPPIALSQNGRIHYTRRAALVSEYRSVVQALACGLVPVEARPYFPDAIRHVRMDIAVSRWRGAQTRDSDNLIASLKSTRDALEGVVYRRDSVIYYGLPVLWDDPVSGDGIAILRLTAVADPWGDAWPDLRDDPRFRRRFAAVG